MLMNDQESLSQTLIVQKKRLLLNIIDQLCGELELTHSQYEAAKDRYEAVGEWLAGSEIPYLKHARIYPQGSIALGTLNKPYKGNEFDIDLVCFLPTIINEDAHIVKALIGERLKMHGKYSVILEEKARCWRINYANEFHLDITPSIINPHCNKRGELVPDKYLLSWKPTNPQGYLARFEYYSSLQPQFSLAGAMFDDKHANIQRLPDQTMEKPILKRIVQFLKRHRDHMFISDHQRELAPISIILTTLAAWSYGYCLHHKIYNSSIDLIVDVIQGMPHFIKIEEGNGQKRYFIENETTNGENFADKWNHNPLLAEAFFNWHTNMLASIKCLNQLEGLDLISKHLQDNYGFTSPQVTRALAPYTSDVSSLRVAGNLVIAPSVGISTFSTEGKITVRPNTFYGS